MSYVLIVTLTISIFHQENLEEGQNSDLLLTCELSYRGMPTNGTIKIKWESLCSALEAEAFYGSMTKLVLSTDEASAFHAAEDAIPCIMHGRNRIGEQIFMMLLIELWSKCVSNPDRMDLVETFENFINRGVFGTEQSRSQWKLPIKKELEIEAVSFTAWHGRKVRSKLSNLAKILFQDMDNIGLRQWQVMLS
jgi:hypothetical protein